MSTSATYTIDGTTFYCHWDGYPAGAAGRFINMIEQLTVPETGARSKIDAIEDRRGGMAFAFIRGNMDAEPAKRGEMGVDFDYEITTNPDGEAMVAVSQRTDDGMKVYATQALDVFIREAIDKYELATGEVYNTEEIFRAVTGGKYDSDRIRYATRKNAEKICERYVELAEQFNTKNPNHLICLKAADQWDSYAER